MKILHRLLPVFALFALTTQAAPARKAAGPGQEKLIAAVRAADDERVAATIAADRSRLEAIYSDDLNYAHSSGKVDTKSSQIQGITAGGNRYEKFEYKERTFVPAGPGVVLMRGRMLMHLASKAGGKQNALDLNFLAVWREEGGKWRFLAWQSCKNPEPGAKK
ncbi:MAG: nuclear transport factor 2 family protein [Opitutaceae bacterium]|nr:nuclear transport factor 2 family protein [Opitutaceae bacterium]